MEAPIDIGQVLELTPALRSGGKEWEVLCREQWQQTETVGTSIYQKYEAKTRAI